MTREELVEAVEKAKTAKNIALAEVTAAHDALIAETEANLRVFDESLVTNEEVAAVVDGVESVVSVEAATEPTVSVVEAEVVAEGPTAEEEEILRRAAQIEAKYQK